MAAPQGGGQAFVPRSGPQGGGQAFVPRSGGPQGGGQAFARQGGGNWQGGRPFVGRRHFRGGPGFAFYGAAPYYYDYAYSDCIQLRLIGGYWQRVNVCDYDYDY